MMRSDLVLSLVALLLLSACSRDVNRPKGIPDPPFQGDPPTEPYISPGEPGTYGGVLVLATVNDMRTCNLLLADDASSNDVLGVHVFRSLIDYRHGGDPPDYDAGLCTRWETSPDAKQWTFYLRRGVRWSDGQPFTADDVLFTYDVVRDENVASPLRIAFAKGKTEKGEPVYPTLDKLDDHTIRFTLSEADGMFLDAVYSLWLIPKHKWEQPWREGRFRDVMKAGDDPREVVSLGPFRIVEYVQGQRVVLERNSYFWKIDRTGARLPYLDRVIFLVANNLNTVALKFEAGELDIFTPRVRAIDYWNVKKIEGEQIKVQDLGTSLNTTWLAFNQNNGVNPRTGRPFVELWKQRLFRNQTFRQAVSYAIDRNGLADTVFGGRARPIYHFVSPGDTNWYTQDTVSYPYDPEKARGILKDLDLKDRNGDSVLEDQEGNTLEFGIRTNADNPQRVQAVAFIAQNLAAIGIRIRPLPAPLSVVNEAAYVTFDYDAVLLGWRSGVPTGPINYKNMILSSGPQHVSFPNQPSPSTAWEDRADQLMRSIESSRDQIERKRLYAEIQKIWSDQLPEIELVAELEAMAYKANIGNIDPTPLPPRATWNIEEIYFQR